ncbi:protein mak16 [Silene latifolia]|uniref:protein mak16 n=1 Tax=Silene latifolia TaxID=37657 RepID=UPI003D788E64
MQHDEVIWQVIRHNHCSFMSKIETGKFCRNPYNVTGICNRSSCPLANSRYATIRDHEGVFYLYMKTIERAHMPNKLWERVKLPRNYIKAMEIIDKHMMFWPKLLVHKMKQRLTKMTQMRIRMRKLALKTREKIMTKPRLPSKRDPRRLEKAEKAANIDNKIEEELVQRLIKGVYPDGIHNVNQELWNKYLKKHEIEDELEEPEVEYVEGFEDLEEEDDMEDFGNNAMATIDDDEDGVEDDDDEEDDDDDDDMEETDGKARRRDFSSGSKGKKKPTVLVEVENEDGVRPRQKAVQ